jgi:hypothetical protein
MPSKTRYRDLRNGVADSIFDLSSGRHGPDALCHLDPDIDASALSRPEGWRGAFGQVGAAQGHLSKNGVGVGDLFLFWGLFRSANKTDRWRFSGPREHRIFGWLQVGDVVQVGDVPSAVLAKYPWIESHPHVEGSWPSSNTIYVAADRLTLPGFRAGVPGFGVFSVGKRLTAPGSDKPSTWSLPKWLNPLMGGTGMTYHPAQRWAKDGLVRCAARGQEFVADISGREKAYDWLAGLFEGRR